MDDDDLIYAGIGSREAPAEILKKMEACARYLGSRGFILRSGAAPGSDAAFERGAKSIKAPADIWLPWPGFEQHADTGLYPTHEHYVMAARCHPVFNSLTRGMKALHARNVGQILSRKPISAPRPVKFVVCWTPDGCVDAKTRTRDTGGTATGIVLASSLGIPVFNLYNPGTAKRVKRYVDYLLASV